MDKVLLWCGRLAGLLGFLLCLVSGAIRASGAFWIGSFQAGTVLQAGIAALVFGCFCLLLFLTGQFRR